MTGVLGLQSEMTEREEGLASVGQLGHFGKSQKARTVTGGDFSVCGGVVHPEIIWWKENLSFVFVNDISTTLIEREKGEKSR